MSDPTRKYDEISDTLHITFMPGESGTGIELNENTLLRINTGARSAVGLSLFNYSILAQRTEMGPRSFPLTGLAMLSEELREIALQILQDAPVHDYLTVSAYTPGGSEPIPIMYLQPEIVPSRAA
ncbi:MAG TPA: DUF2283 domain-containing protein [Longimicrobium sp.]|jgi:uncharacterized protein YuzE